MSYASLRRRIADIDYMINLVCGTGNGCAEASPTDCAGRPSAADAMILVDLVADRMPDLTGWPVLLSHESAWAILGRGSSRCLCLGRPVADPAHSLVACFEDDARRATVYYGAQRLPPGPADLALRHAAGYPVDQILLMYYLASRRGLLVHAAGVRQGERALLFPGISGAGKSTLARQFLAVEGSDLLSDDRIIVRRPNGVWRAYGTPWPGELGIITNASAVLAGILFLSRGEGFRLRTLRPQAALDRLLPATSILWFEPRLLAAQLETCEDLLRQVPAFELAWSPGPAIVDSITGLMKQLP